MRRRIKASLAGASKFRSCGTTITQEVQGVHAMVVKAFFNLHNSHTLSAKVWWFYSAVLPL